MWSCTFRIIFKKNNNYRLLHISSPNTPPTPFFPLPKPHPWLRGCVFTDHLCISYANPVGEVMHETPEPSCPLLWLEVRLVPLAFSRQSATSEITLKGKKKKWPHPERKAAVYGRLVLQLPNWTALHKPDPPSALEEKHSEGAYKDA